MIFGIALVGIGALVGLMGLSELGSYATLTSAGNPFAGLKGDLGIALTGVGAIGVLGGIAFIIVSTQFKNESKSLPAVAPGIDDGQQA